jgi:hypothetical protein
MRIYVPATLRALAKARDAGMLEAAVLAIVPGATELPAHSVTPAVREWYVEGDLEDLEYSAMLDAAEASLDLIGADPDAPRRRVVVAADVPDDAVVPGGRFRSSVRVACAVPIGSVVSVHVDEPEAEDVVRAAVAAVPAAAAGDEDAQFLLDEAESRDLLWYDVSELGDLV